MPPLDPMILAVAPTGARRSKLDTPSLPITIEEIAEEARRCADNCASLLHLHIRNARGEHTLDAGMYHDAISAIREATAGRLIIQVTTESAGVFQRNEQIAAAVEIDADSISLAVREICPDDASEPGARDLYKDLNRRGVLAQHIVYNDDDLQRLRGLQEKGVIEKSPLFVQLVLGRYGERSEGGPAEMLAFLAALKPLSVIWSVCCFGPWEPSSVAAAAAFGGHARVGFENNNMRTDGCKAASNAEIVAQSAEIIRTTGRPLANADDIRKMFPILMR